MSMTQSVIVKQACLFLLLALLSSFIVMSPAQSSDLLVAHYVQSSAVTSITTEFDTEQDRSRFPLSVSGVTRITNESNATADYTVVTEADDIVITTEPMAGTLAAGETGDFRITVDIPDGTLAGVYNGQININSPGGTFVITVEVVATDPLVITPSSLTAAVSLSELTTPLTLPILIDNQGSGRFAVDYAADVRNATGLDITVSPSSGALERGQSIDLNASVKLENMVSGLYTAEVEISSSRNSTVVIPITLLVAEQVERLYLPTIVR